MLLPYAESSHGGPFRLFCRSKGLSDLKAGARAQERERWMVYLLTRGGTFVLVDQGCL